MAGPDPCGICGELNWGLYDIPESSVQRDGIKACHDCIEVLDEALFAVHKAADKIFAKMERRLKRKQIRKALNESFHKAVYDTRCKAFGIVDGVTAKVARLLGMKGETK